MREMLRQVVIHFTVILGEGMKLVWGLSAPNGVFTRRASLQGKHVGIEEGNGVVTMRIDIIMMST
jgi:hypothetical protein